MVGDFSLPFPLCHSGVSILMVHWWVVLIAFVSGTFLGVIIMLIDDLLHQWRRKP